VPLDVDALFCADGTAQFRKAFDALHERIFAVRDEGSDVEIIGLRAAVRCNVRTRTDFRLDASANVASEVTAPRQVYFHGQGRVETQVMRLEAMEADVARIGPAIIESPFTTIVVDSAARYHRSSAGSIVIYS
jgi:N-methylhydantoinase A